MEVTERADGLTVVNDAYNSNPESMRAALTALAALGEGRRTWAVLGRMAEQGDETGAVHAEIAAVARELGIDRFVAVGTTDYPGAERAADVGEALALLRAEAGPGDVVLVKASRAVGLERVAEGLLQTAGPVPR
jgi:UDP-N-acetylmuramoyl-tripeptide--D-alanyl-D-alanine ligase